MTLQKHQKVTITLKHKNRIFKANQKVQHLYTDNIGHKFQALSGINGNRPKEGWLTEDEFKI